MKKKKTVDSSTKGVLAVSKDKKIVINDVTVVALNQSATALSRIIKNQRKLVSSLPFRLPSPVSLRRLQKSHSEVLKAVEAFDKLKKERRRHSQTAIRRIKRISQKAENQLRHTKVN
jgi:hypothetical protein